MSKSRSTSEILPARAPHVRASDVEREAVIARLSEHTATGRLTLAEFEERVSAAYTAQYLGDLDELVTDLPAPAAAPRTTKRHSGRWDAWRMTAVVCLLIWGLTSLADLRLHYFWPIWVLGPWGAVIASGLLFGSRCRGAR